jgi:phosphonopyruvate decarboxylase
VISPADFVQTLKEQGVRSFTGVPCSFFQAAINYVLDQKDLQYTIVPNEGSALALASGAQMAGRPTALLIQNSGFGNLVNPLTSLNMIYNIPVLIFMSGRAYGVEDEPQHEIIGKTMGPILDAMAVRHEDMPSEVVAFGRSLKAAIAYMTSSGQPFVYFVRSRSIDEYVPDKKADPTYPLKRMDAIKIIMEELAPDDHVFAATGKPSRELFAVKDRPQNFYMQGSMGHASSLALGAALAQPTKRMIVLDGDGAILMHLGMLSSIGHYQPKNLYHIVLDNEAYETTGDQDTTSGTTALEKIATASGYVNSVMCHDEAGLRKSLRECLTKPGPAFIRVKINRIPTLNIPRISSKHSSPQIATNFTQELSR